ncbi:MAG: tyrosine--tRNA ligase [SAR202 cluster bacterium]|nr:tyrosine--tRNA ligase [SAR202 cluster bacterium]
MDQKQIDRVLRRGVAEVIVEAELRKLLESGQPLRLKMGFDPTAPDLHLGHAVGLRKLRQLQDLGHKVVVIVGDWTARIGDPSGRSATRPMLTEQQVLANAETYLNQFFKIVDRSKTETRLQSDWFGPFTLADVIRLTSKFTVAQFLAREDFAKRFKSNQPIAITEILYPLMQAYDSVVINSDIEFGGTDQKFNLLVGRELQVMSGQRPQQCLIVPILPGTDGMKKMSKSLGNYVGLTEPPNDMFGKIMRLPDLASDELPDSGATDRTKVNGSQSLILMYMEYLTDIPDEEIAEMKAALEASAVNPMELKKRLGREIVGFFHSPEDALAAERHFEQTVQRREVPKDIETYPLPARADLMTKRLSRFLAETGLVPSAAEGRRLISQGAVQVDGERVDSDVTAEFLKPGSILRVGRQRMIRLASHGA